MKRSWIVSCVVLVVLLIAGSSSAGKVPLPSAPSLDLGEITRLPLTAAFVVGDELASQEDVVRTSPFDKLRFATGAFTVELFERNLPQVFAAVTDAEDAAADAEVSVELVRFMAGVPHPAYKPYTASVTYRVTVSDPGGTVLFSETVTGEGQTSKGMMSGFKAKQLCGEAAKLAMADAAVQALQGLVDAPELRELGRASGEAEVVVPAS